MAHKAHEKQCLFHEFHANPRTLPSGLDPPDATPDRDRDPLSHFGLAGLTLQANARQEAVHGSDPERSLPQQDPGGPGSRDQESFSDSFSPLTPQGEPLLLALANGEC